MVEEKKTSKFQLTYLAVLLIFVFGGEAGNLNSALQVCIEAWPNVAVSTVRLLSTLAQAVSMIVMIPLGTVVGKKITYKTTVVIGLVLSCIGAVGPYFYAPNFTVVLIFRAIIGIGTGFLSVRNALISLSIPAELQAKYIGYGNLIMNINTTVTNIAVGALSVYGWSTPLLYNFLIIPILIAFLIMFREPTAETNAFGITPDENALKKSAEGERLSYKAVVYAVMQFLATLSLYPLLSGMSTFFAFHNLGSAALAGTVLSVYSFAGMFVNLILPTIKKVFGKFTAPVSFATVAVGQAIFLFFPSVLTAFLGTALCGMGFFVNFSMFYVYNAQVSPASKIALGSSLILTLNQAAMFLSNYYIDITHKIFNLATDIDSSWLGCVIVYAVMVVILTVFNKQLIPEQK